MLKKILISLLVFTSIIFNSYSVQVVEIDTLSDLAFMPNVVEYVKEHGSRSVLFKPKKSDANNFQEALVGAMNGLLREDICIFESKETYERNKVKAREVIFKWVKVFELNYYKLSEELGFPFDMAITLNIIERNSEEKVLIEMQKIEENFKKVPQ